MHDLDVLISRLDDATSEHRLLEHPFYKAWAAGELTLEDLSHYSAQYWRQVEAFPGYLDAVERRLDSQRAREIVRDNLRDEIEQDHPGLWLDFAEVVGVRRSSVTASTPEEETIRCVTEFRQVVGTRSLPYALGMLYGYESQTPAVAETKVAGLKQHYGIEGRGVEYFRLHGVLDVEHSRSMAEAISLVGGDPSEAEAGARRGSEAIWGLLDGVERVRHSG